MSVTMQCRADEPGATKMDYSGYPGDLYVRTTYVGQVVALRERNMYDDSDFYATVWDEAQQKFIDVEYATTRGWTYANGASIDADVFLQDKWLHEQQRRHDAIDAARRYAVEVRDYGKPLAEVKAALALPVEQWERLESMGKGTRVFIASIKLLTAKLRSPFRKSLREQLQKWLRGESKYPTPFSPKQQEYL